MCSVFGMGFIINAANTEFHKYILKASIKVCKPKCMTKENYAKVMFVLFYF